MGNQQTVQRSVPHQYGATPGRRVMLCYRTADGRVVVQGYRGPNEEWVLRQMVLVAIA